MEKILFWEIIKLQLPKHLQAQSFVVERSSTGQEGKINLISANLGSYLSGVILHEKHFKLNVEIKSRTGVTIKISSGQISTRERKKKKLIIFISSSTFHFVFLLKQPFFNLQFFILATRINGTIQMIFHVIKIQFSYSFITFCPFIVWCKFSTTTIPFIFNI